MEEKQKIVVSIKMESLTGQVEDPEAIGDPNHLPPMPPALQPANNPTQVQLEDNEWETIFKPWADRIVLHGITFFLSNFRDVRFEVKLEVQWADLPRMLVQSVIAASVLHSIVALFSANMISRERCQQVRFSFIWITIGMALVVVTPIILMATSYLASPT